MTRLRIAALCLACALIGSLALPACTSRADTAPVRFIEYTDPESPYCIEVAPIVERLRAEYEPLLDGFDIVDVTSTSGSAQAEEAGVFVTPTFVVTDDDGTELDRIIGQASEAELRAMLDDAIAAE